ncbi:hypothetical protein RF11_12239 [Thelohanellus kitauei]|uniref:Uncharacterized protein n=1 Tax=Thelohanellus kitauei TaxID=669202 RepID=A0A0C2IC19_THEKT|nr:hypothetical protein RF11_12239 [Thelohanellus kitauei]
MSVYSNRVIAYFTDKVLRQNKETCNHDPYVWSINRSYPDCRLVGTNNNFSQSLIHSEEANPFYLTKHWHLFVASLYDTELQPILPQVSLNNLVAGAKRMIWPKLTRELFWPSS